jgi:apolipoprotein N-acyltransferase
MSASDPKPTPEADRISVFLQIFTGADDMDGRLSKVLKLVAKRTLFLAAAVFVIGFCWIVAEAPCSNTGIYILLSSVGLAALSACMLFVRALLVRTLDAFGLCVAIAFYAFIGFAISSYTALMLCRGV